VFHTVSEHKLADVFSSPIGFKNCFIENYLHLMSQNSCGCCLIPTHEVGETSRERESWLHVASSIDSEPPWPDNLHFNCHEAITMYPAMHPRPDRPVHLDAWRHRPGYDATYWSLQMYTPSIPCHSSLPPPTRFQVWITHKMMVLTLTRVDRQILQNTCFNFFSFSEFY
jgi:hypothetical protein